MADLRERLLAEREQLRQLAAMGEEAARTVELDQQRQGRLSRMDAMQAQAVAGATSRRRSLQQRRLAAALERMEAGDYGACLDCGEAIAAGRLDVDPAAEYCLDCAAARD